MAAAAGAWVSHPFPLVLVALAALVVLALRRPVLLCVAVAVAASALGARAEAGLRSPPTGYFSGVVTLVGDPSDAGTGAGGALKVEVRLRGRRVEAQARGRDAARLRARLAGERVAVNGELKQVPASARPYLWRRHVVARLDVAEVGAWAAGNAPSRLANGVRRTLVTGADSMSLSRRALFVGFVLGDDRGQPVEVVDDFRSSGLSHLLVVSGQNVAFVLALAAPGLRRLRLGWRFAVGLALLALFGVLTRWEPSVLRAEAMAALSLLTATVGRPASSVRVLAIAVTALLLIDPFLVGSIGFLLSVGASAGIALLARPIAAALPGPRFLSEPIAITLAAQVGVAPILLPVFGGLPVASLPANLLAVPLAGPVMMWGIAAGLPAGLVGGPLARLIHIPTNVVIAWIAGVAHWGASLPLGRLEMAHAVAIGVAVLVGAVGPGRTRSQVGAGARMRPNVGAGAVSVAHRCLGAAAIAFAVIVVILPAVAVRWPSPIMDREVGTSVSLWRRQGATVLVVHGSSAAPGRLLAALRAQGVRRLDVIVIEPAGVKAPRSLEPTLRRIPAGMVLAPADSPMPAARAPDVGERIGIGGLVVEVTSTSPKLQVRVAPADP